MRLIDTHCHLNDRKAFPDPVAAVEESFAAGVEKLIVVAVDTEWSQIALDLADQFEGVYAVVGWHPSHSAQYNTAELKKIEAMLKHPKALAVGEIGLDYHWDYATKEQQFACLHDHLALAESTGKPVVFHCREAYSDLLELLESRPVLPCLFHCWAGTREEAQRVLDLGGYLGVDGPLTYAKADETRAQFASFPHDRILIETDAPWMTPVPFRGQRNKMAYLPFVNSALAKCWEVSEEESAQITWDNAHRFFRIP